MKNKWCLLLLLLLAGPELHAQMWTFQGSQICYDFGIGPIQCFSHGTIQGFVTDSYRNRAMIDRSYEAGRQLGEGVGSLAAALIARWMEHRARVRAETEALEKQLAAYFDAEISLVEEQRRLEASIKDQTAQLRVLDAANKKKWENQLQESQELYEHIDKYLSDLKSLRDKELKQRSRRALAGFLDSPSGAKVRYDRQRKMTARNYALNEFLKAVVGWYKQNQNQEETKPQQKVSRARILSCPSGSWSGATCKHHPPGAATPN